MSVGMTSIIVENRRQGTELLERRKRISRQPSLGAGGLRLLTIPEWSARQGCRRVFRDGFIPLCLTLL
jgi:hypothetical protein